MLEIISSHSSIKLKYIFLHNNNWFNFYNSHKHLLRESIIQNVVKMLSCRTPLLGYHLYTCQHCNIHKKIPHSCKSRFCTSCAKAATDIWINKAINTLPDVKYQHITFTLPDEYWPLFRTNRFLLNIIPNIAAHIVLDICKYGKKRKHYLPGIFLAIHTFGRDNKYNVHIHLSVTFGGFRINKNNKVTQEYIQGSIIKESIIKNMWKYQITTLLRTLYKQNKLIPYNSSKKHFYNLYTFNKWLDSHYQKTWNVFLQYTQNGAKLIASYLGRYLKRPPLAETRITKYDGSHVTFWFKDHYTNVKQTKTLPVTDFIKMLIVHIPDKHFKMIRYFGFLANRVRSKYINLFDNIHVPKEKYYLSHLKRFLKDYNKNPLKCPCGRYLSLSYIIFATPLSILLIRHNIKARSIRPP